VAPAVGECLLQVDSVLQGSAATRPSWVVVLVLSLVHIYCQVCVSASKIKVFENLSIFDEVMGRGTPAVV